MQQKQLQALILTEGSKDIGFGHITRMQSLYEELKSRGYSLSFVIQGDETVGEILPNITYQILDWRTKETCITLLEKTQPDFVIVDSYKADLALYEIISKQSLLVSMDDTNRLAYPAGIVLKPTEDETRQSDKKNVQWLSGKKYTLLRHAFSQVTKKNTKKDISTIFVTFGGDDIRELTPLVIRVLQEKNPQSKKIIIVGNGFAQREKEEIKILSQKDQTIKPIYNATASDMKKSMEISDIVISAAGQTLNECAVTGSPTIAVGVADNQRTHFASFEKTRFLISAGWVLRDTDKKKFADTLATALHKIKDPALRKEQSVLGQKLIDGLGAKRIIDSILNNL